MKFVIDVSDDKRDVAEELFKNISFIKNIQLIEANEVTNPVLLQSIEQYESKSTIPTPLSLDDLKKLIYA
ncbi:MAG: hypothetical protein U0Y96_08440 [Candidatus Kapaibacterium sp.]|nr:hypothetical protein [Bacteroidota bacterium]